MQLIHLTLITLLISNHAISGTRNIGPNIVVSIRPIHSIVSSLTQSVVTPTLLIKDLSSPHHYSLKPSDLKSLSKADLLIRVSPTLESNLNKALHHMQDTSTSLTLANNTKLTRLKSHAKTSVKKTAFDSRHTADSLDTHLWLNPLNMIIAAEDILNTLKQIDPTHSNIYDRNFRDLEAELKILNLTLSQKFSRIQNQYFLVAHNAYQYLEDQYALQSIGALTDHPDQPPSIKHILYIKQQIQAKSVRCLFYEPDSPKRLIEQVTRDYAINSVEIDYMGYQHTIGQSLYPEMMTMLADKIVECLE